jgi:hypothetical protein
MVACASSPPSTPIVFTFLPPFPRIAPGPGHSSGTRGLPGAGRGIGPDGLWENAGKMRGPFRRLVLILALVGGAAAPALGDERSPQYA